MQYFLLVCLTVFVVSCGSSPVSPTPDNGGVAPDQSLYETLPATHPLKDVTTGTDTVVSIELLSVTPLRGSVAPRLSNYDPCQYNGKDCLQAKFRIHFPATIRNVVLYYYYAADQDGRTMIGHLNISAYTEEGEGGEFQMKILPDVNIAPRYIFFRAVFDETTYVGHDDITATTAFLLDYK